MKKIINFILNCIHKKSLAIRLYELQHERIKSIKD